MSSTQRWLQNNLIPYPQSSILYSHILTLLRSVPSLSPKSDVYTYDDGRTQLLLCIHGLLPIAFRGAEYNIPIAVWITRDYPRHPPIPYVVPTTDMLVKPSMYVDTSGRCSIQYILHWEKKSESCNLLGLIEAMQDHFSREPPLYAKPASPADPPALPPKPPRPPPTPTLHPPPPPPTTQNLLDQDPPPPVHVLPPPRPPNPELLRLHAQVSHKLSAELASFSQVMASDTRRLRALQSDLLSGEPAIRDEMSRLHAVRDVCKSVSARLKTTVEHSERNIAELRRKGDPEVDELVCSTTIVHNQLINLVAEDNAIEDAIYHLHRALNSGRVDLERFLRTTRVLAEEQFMKRALIGKIKDGLPMAIPTESNWS